MPVCMASPRANVVARKLVLFLVQGRISKRRQWRFERRCVLEGGVCPNYTRPMHLADCMRILNKLCLTHRLADLRSAGHSLQREGLAFLPLASPAYLRHRSERGGGCRASEKKYIFVRVVLGHTPTPQTAAGNAPSLDLYSCTAHVRPAVGAGRQPHGARRRGRCLLRTALGS